MFLTVYGPGLALRGPLGSMLKAVEGMKIEQDTMLKCYVCLIGSFALSILASFFLVMTPKAAYISTSFFALQAYGWYHYTLRIYNRFKFDAVQVGNFEDDDHKDPAPSSSFDPKKNPTPVKKDSTHTLMGVNFSNYFGPSSAGNTQNASKTKNELDKEGCDDKQILYAKAKKLSMEGFLLKKGMTYSSLMPDSWKRKYFVLKEFELRFYNSKADYLSDSNNAGRARPIDLSGMAFNSFIDKDGNMKMTLEPILDDDNRRRWTFMCDDEDEFEEWKKILGEVCDAANFIDECEASEEKYQVIK